MVHGHNSDIKIRLAENEGRFNNQAELDEELAGLDIDVRLLCADDADDGDYPSEENFLPNDTYKQIMDQRPLALESIAVAYPSQPQYRAIKNCIRGCKMKRFMAISTQSKDSFQRFK